MTKLEKLRRLAYCNAVDARDKSNKGQHIQAGSAAIIANLYLRRLRQEINFRASLFRENKTI